MAISNYIPSSRIAQSGVCTSSTRPASPFEGQMIFETDTHRVLIWDNAAWVEIASTLTKAPRGLVGFFQSTANQNLNTTVTDLTGASVTFMAEAGRGYLCTFSAVARKLTSTNYIQTQLTTGSNTVLMDVFETVVGGEYCILSFNFLVTGLASGTQTLKCRVAVGSDTGIIFGTAGANPYSFAVTDVGAV